MRILLATLNAKYIHPSLALRYLKQIAKTLFPAEISMEEFTINEPLLRIVDKIYLFQPDVVAFSCYIWNIVSILKIISLLKKTQPNLKIILGGPEASARAAELSRHPGIDLIVQGEGEEAWKLLLNEEFKINNLNLKQPKILSIPVTDENLSFLPFPYEEKEDLFNRLTYYETSRGCPFNCSFCLSSLTERTRFAPLSKVKEEIAWLVKNNAKNIKFLDRTFNLNQQRTLYLWEYFLGLEGQTKFYFEIVAQSLTQKELSFLTSVPEGKFQFEIGIQTIHEDINKLCHRRQNWKKAKEKLLFLKQNTRISLHLDLIAGLPMETTSSFAQSFDEVYRLFGDELQLGFLKLLPGTLLRQEASKYGYLFGEEPPYEILQSNSFSYRELIIWHDIEELLSYYYNPHLADSALFWLTEKTFSSPTIFYQTLAAYFRQQNLFDARHGSKELFSILADFYKAVVASDYDIFLQLLKFEWLKQDKSGRYPDWCPTKSVSREEKQYWLEKILDSDFRKQYLPSLMNFTKDKLRRLGEIEKFPLNPLNYEKKPVYIYYFYGLPKGKAKTFILP